MSKSLNRVELKEFFESLYHIQKKSISDIAQVYGKSTSTTRYWMMKSGISLRTPADGMRLAGYKTSQRQRGKKVIFTKSRIENIRKAKIAHGEKYAKGYRLTQYGYLEYTRGEFKGRLIHVVNAERFILGRRLQKHENVHHKDLNKLNNNVDNLEVMTRSAHTRYHALLNYKKRKRDDHGRFT
jgi:hypothetical protein